MMFCKGCGALIPEGAALCDDCTARIALLGPPQQGQAQPGRPPDQYGYEEQGQAAPQQPYFSPGDAFAQPPGGPVPPPSVADYQLQSQRGHQYPGGGSQVAGGRRSGVWSESNALTAASISGGCGVVVFISTFLPWLSLGGLFTFSGWSYMVHPGQLGSGNFLWYSGPGFLFFTGFFSLLVGLAVITGSALFLFAKMPLGARVAQVAGALGALFALINLITLYTHAGGSGIGIWIFLLFSIGAGISGELCIKSLR